MYTSIITSVATIFFLIIIIIHTFALHKWTIFSYSYFKFDNLLLLLYCQKKHQLYSIISHLYFQFFLIHFLEKKYIEFSEKYFLSFQLSHRSSCYRCNTHTPRIHLFITINFFVIDKRILTLLSPNLSI